MKNDVGQVLNSPTTKSQLFFYNNFRKQLHLEKKRKKKEKKKHESQLECTIDNTRDDGSLLHSVLADADALK